MRRDDFINAGMRDLAQHETMLDLQLTKLLAVAKTRTLRVVGCLYYWSLKREARKGFQRSLLALDRIKS